MAALSEVPRSNHLRMQAQQGARTGRTSGSEQPAAVGNALGRSDQDHIAVGIRKPERQHIRTERADLTRPEVDNRRNLPADEDLGTVMARDLGR